MSLLMTLGTDAGKFLRAAVKTGLRLQQAGQAAAPGGGVQTLQRIKASMRKRSSNRRQNL
jgi:hypothetical protein